MSPLRKFCAIACTINLAYVTVRVTAAFHGHVGDRDSFALALVSGVFALPGLLLALRGSRRG